jgi:hypothetical protein
MACQCCITECVALFAHGVSCDGGPDWEDVAIVAATSLALDYARECHTTTGAVNATWALCMREPMIRNEETKC